MYPSAVCLPCQRTMIEDHNAPRTAWISSEKKEKPCLIVRCPECCAHVALVNGGIERHAEEPEPDVLPLDV